MIYRDIYLLNASSIELTLFYFSALPFYSLKGNLEIFKIIILCIEYYNKNSIFPIFKQKPAYEIVLSNNF